jgi:hypothetical protein
MNPSILSIVPSCSRAPAPATADTARLAAIEQRLSVMESNIADLHHLNAGRTSFYTDACVAFTNFNQRIQSLEKWRLAFAERPVSGPMLDPATGQPVGADPSNYRQGRIDPATGLPLRDRPRQP